MTHPREYGACSDVRRQIERNLRRESASLDRPCRPSLPTFVICVVSILNERDFRVFQVYLVDEALEKALK